MDRISFLFAMTLKSFVSEKGFFPRTTENFYSNTFFWPVEINTIKNSAIISKNRTDFTTPVKLKCAYNNHP